MWFLGLPGEVSAVGCYAPAVAFTSLVVDRPSRALANCLRNFCTGNVETR
jgi:hypothetical protein